MWWDAGELEAEGEEERKAGPHVLTPHSAAPPLPFQPLSCSDACVHFCVQSSNSNQPRT